MPATTISMASYHAQQALNAVKCLDEANMELQVRAMIRSLGGDLNTYDKLGTDGNKLGYVILLLVGNL